MIRLALTLSVLTIVGCDLKKGPKEIKVWPASDLAEFNQDDGKGITAERRPIAEVETENALLRAKIESLKSENASLIQKLSGSKERISFQEAADHIRLHDTEINSLWSAFHRLEERVKQTTGK